MLAAELQQIEELIDAKLAEFEAKLKAPPVKVEKKAEPAPQADRKSNR